MAAVNTICPVSGKAIDPTKTVVHEGRVDEALALPTDFSARIARNTQLFLQQESGTTRIIDPWAAPITSND